MIDRIIHVSDTLDPSTRLPLVVVDSTQLPAPDSDQFSHCVSNAISKLPECNYVMLFFACGAPSKPSWSWVAKAYAMLERSTKKRIRKIYVVHESWWVRAIIEMLRGVVSSKFKSKVVHVSSLSHLAQLIDITLINIRPAVYVHDRKIQDQITIPRHPTPVYGMPLSVGSDGSLILPQAWSDLINYLWTSGTTTKRIFRPTDNPELLYILRDCFDRNQLIDLDDYGPHLAAAALKLYLYQLPSVVLPLGAVRLPIQDTQEYCLQVLNTLSESSKVLLGELMDLLAAVVRNQLTTDQTPSSLAACVGPSLLGPSAVSKEGIAIGVRFTRNLIEYWPDISGRAPTNGNPLPNPMAVKKQRPPPVPPSRGTSVSNISLSSALPSAISSTIASTFVSSPSLHSRNTSTPELHTRYRREDESSMVPSVSASDPHLPKAPPRSQSKSPVKVTSQIKPMGPPPVPNKRPLLVLQPIHNGNSNIERAGIEKPLSPVRKFGTKSKAVVSTGRGKMVAELAKLYEERSTSAKILVDIDRKRRVP